LIYNQNKALIRNIQNAGLYFLGSVLQGILALAAQPIYSMHLTANDFGIIGYFWSIQSVFTPIFILGMSSVYLMRYFKQGENENKKLLFNLTFFLCCFNTLTIFIGYLGIYLYFKFMHVMIPLNPFAWFILSALLLENIKSAVLINYRIRKKALLFFAFSASNSILNFGLGLFFVAYLEWGAVGRMFAPLISSLLLLPWCIYILRKYSIVNFNYDLFVKAIKVAFPLVLAAYAYVPIVSIDRFFLERLNNLAELGLYSIGIMIAGYIQLAYTALVSTFEPDIFRSVAEGDLRRLMIVAGAIFVPFLFLVVAFMLFSGTIISLLTAGRYIAAKKYADIALLAIYFLSLFDFMDKIFIALGKTHLNLFVNILGGSSAIIIMYFTISNLGYIGAAYGRVLIALVMVITSFIFIIKHLRGHKVIV
jgi:O-antigen/teichoic acid export membrane protein